MTIQDQVIGALCCWRENRGGGVLGMQSVMNVLVNRATKRLTDVYTEATRRLQFSSMTAAGDPNLILYPSPQDPQGWSAWLEALTIAGEAAAGSLEDITEGATSYYATSMTTPPYWASSMTRTVTIANQIFFK